MIIDYYIDEAFDHPATTYGWGESFCGEDNNNPQPCLKGALTASGKVFDPEVPHVAVHAPKNLLIRHGLKVCMLSKKGLPIVLPVTDKKGNAGFDLSPEAIRLLGFTPTHYWQRKLQRCPSFHLKPIGMQGNVEVWNPYIVWNPTCKKEQKELKSRLSDSISLWRN